MLYSRLLLVTYFIHSSVYIGLPRLGLVVKNTPANSGEMCVLSLGWKDPLEGGMATTPVLLPEESSWTEKPRGPQSMGSQRVGHD